MEIKRPFSWTSCSCGPSPEGVQEGSRRAGPQGCPENSSASPGEIDKVPSSPQIPAPEEALLRRPVATAESSEKARRARRAQSHPSWKQWLLGPARSPSCCRH